MNNSCGAARRRKSFSAGDQSTAKQSKAKQSKAKQSKAKQSKVKQSKAQQSTSREARTNGLMANLDILREDLSALIGWFSPLPAMMVAHTNSSTPARTKQRLRGRSEEPKQTKSSGEGARAGPGESGDRNRNNWNYEDSLAPKAEIHICIVEEGDFHSKAFIHALQKCKMVASHATLRSSKVRRWVKLSLKGFLHDVRLRGGVWSAS